ncbi:DUF1643 domain-containing protein [Kitasatospora sp. NPDC048365]|uniref:DUF1643 domain-containing protein n=1 Tax=Kitasatospora sp. NPDC048365 TaxID=3364050 RepID=UPI003723381D
MKESRGPDDGSQETGALCAVLLNPPLRTSEETVSFRNLKAALPLFNCTALRIVNLVDIATRDQIELQQVEIAKSDILRSRGLICDAIEEADDVLLAWGSSRISGEVGRLLRDQADWVRAHLRAGPTRRVWTTAGKPRHPSRWRQYVGPQKQRATGSSFEERLASVLTLEA